MGSRGYKPAIHNFTTEHTAVERAVRVDGLREVFDVCGAHTRATCRDTVSSPTKPRRSINCGASVHRRAVRFVKISLRFDQQTRRIRVVVPRIDINFRSKCQSSKSHTHTYTQLRQEMFYVETRNTFCGTWYLPHSQVHSDRAVHIMGA